MKVALVHDWFLQRGGAEDVTAAIYQVLRPLNPEVFAIISSGHTVRALWGADAPQRVHTSWLDKLPWMAHGYKIALPLFPSAMRSLRTDTCDVVVSSSHSAAKNIRKKPGAIHICYCHTPSRYLWVWQKEYLQDYGLNRPLIKPWVSHHLEKLKAWDLKGTESVDYFLANSRYIADRIREFYRREATVVYPPVDTDFFTPAENLEGHSGYYFTSSRDVPYKKLDLILWAFNQMPDLRLVMATQPSALRRLKRYAASNVQLVPMGSREEYRAWLRGAKAYVFAARDDFGIGPVEAMACGTPVIALAQGGALETVQEGVNGFFFASQSVKSLHQAIQRFETDRQNLPDRATIRQSVLRFSRKRFEDEIMAFLREAVPQLFPAYA